MPTLRGRTVATLFFEDSTRTRMSFETAAKRMSADVLSFAAGSSSVKKGESLRDTIETIQAIGMDAVIVRHSSSGVPARVARWVDHCAVVNAGDGWHQHPTQALLDLYTVRQSLGGGDEGTDAFGGLRVTIVGDIRHSRVARSQIAAYAALGAEVTLVAPATLLPPSLEGWPVAAVSHDLDGVLETTDVISLLRLQAERGSGAYVPTMREYTAGYASPPAGPCSSRPRPSSCTRAPWSGAWRSPPRWPNCPRRASPTRSATVWRCAWPSSSCCSATARPRGRHDRQRRPDDRAWSCAAAPWWTPPASDGPTSG